MKQNKKYLAIIFIVIILVGILSITAYADNNRINEYDFDLSDYVFQSAFSGLRYTSGFENQPIPTPEAYPVTDSNGLVMYISNNNNYKGCINSSASDTYVFYCDDYKIVACSPNQGGCRYQYNSRITLSNYNDNLYWGNITSVYGSDPVFYIPYFETLSLGLSAVNQYINNSSTSTYDLDYSLPPGNLAFVELTSDSSDLILTTDMPTLSNLFGEAWSNVSQMYGYSNSLPSSGSSFNTSGLTTIDWSKAAPFNVLGQSKNAAKILSVSTSSTYLVIYNPLYFYVRDGGNGAESSFLDNGYIRIRLNDIRNVKVFSLTSSAQIGPNASTEDAISSTVTSSGVTQTIDPDTGLPIWTDSDGNTVEAPGIGTGNIASSGTTTFSILQQIADTISNFFQGSVGAISNLIDNGSSFMSKLGTLYSWLPPPVYAVLTSALILVITIGVIKVFL